MRLTCIGVPLNSGSVFSIAFPLAVRATVRGRVLDAELLDIRGRTRYQSVEYGSPSGAGQVAGGWSSCNGWRLWHYKDPETGEWRAIDALRGGTG